ncbi:MAG: ABC transporter ATP-binding protein [Bacteroidota bacterium]|nr:ABC transporter ATP-binding protein [Bacteroidota bacterium]
MSTVIKVENISKQYRLGQVGTGSLVHDVNRTWQRIRGKEDPYLKIGEVNDRSTKGSSDYVWALQDINFEVQQGEVLGIIGRNGAGKSTLLKILSRTTTPTTGSVKIKGRVASLLEVGTGFHPDLSGRENIFLNGAILGMTRQEIKNKFDEIVDFAGVERYIDTPVKRYSSGMYVRLAFGVAAHLEPEILIVDEVLAVGDAEFQKKALGKMKDVSNKEGRTVIFVSHNMAAVQNLCNKGIYLKNGSVAYSNDTDSTIRFYLNDIKNNSIRKLHEIKDRRGSGRLKLLEIIGYNSKSEISDIFLCGENIHLKILFEKKESFIKIKGRVDIGINDQYDTRVAWLSTSIFDDFINVSEEGLMFQINKLSLAPGSYTLNIFCEVEGEVADWLENVYSFEIAESDFYSTGKKIPAGQGYLFMDYKTNC